MEQVTSLQTENAILQKTVDELKRELEAVILDAECLRDEREEIEKLLQVDSKENLSNTGEVISEFKIQWLACSTNLFNVITKPINTQRYFDVHLTSITFKQR